MASSSSPPLLQLLQPSYLLQLRRHVLFKWGWERAEHNWRHKNKPRTWSKTWCLLRVESSCQWGGRSTSAFWCRYKVFDPFCLLAQHWSPWALILILLRKRTVAGLPRETSNQFGWAGCETSQLQRGFQCYQSDLYAYLKERSTEIAKGSAVHGSIRVRFLPSFPCLCKCNSICSSSTCVQYRIIMYLGSNGFLILDCLIEQIGALFISRWLIDFGCGAEESSDQWTTESLGEKMTMIIWSK